MDASSPYTKSVYEPRLALLLQYSSHLTLRVSFLDIFALVVLLFTANGGDLDFHQSVLSITRNRYQSQPLGGFDTDQGSELFFGEEQASGALGLVVFWHITGLVGLYRHAHDVCFATTHKYMRTVELAPTRPQALHLMAKKLDTCVKGLEDLVVESRLFVFE